MVDINMRATRVLSSHALGCQLFELLVRLLIQLVDAIALCPALTAGDRQMGDLQISHTHTHTPKL